MFTSTSLGDLNLCNTILGIHPPPGSYERWDVKRLEPKQAKSSDEKDGIAKSMLEGGFNKQGNSVGLNLFICLGILIL